MERQFLKELGLADEAIEKVMAENGRDVNKAKGDSEKLSAELEGVKAQLTEAGKKMQSFKDMEPERLAGEVKAWEKKYKDDTAALQEKLAGQQLESKLDLALLSKKARDVRTVKPLLNREKLKLEGETLTGLEEQLVDIAKQSPYLFDGAETNPPPGVGAAAQTDDISKWRTEAGLPPVIKE